jgi:hypothetical protein
MPQSLTQKQVNTFTGGLITEASELTFPENASVDELNCSLERDGTRRRRKAVSLEDNAVTDGIVIPEGSVFHTATWYNVGGLPNLEFLVVQIGSNISFYEKAKEPLSAQRVLNYSIDLATQAGSSGGTISANNSFVPSEEKIQVTSINGLLIVASPAINTFYFERLSDGTFLNEIIDFKERDFEWQGTAYEVEEQYSEKTGSSGSGLITSYNPVSNERKYDTANSGWVGQYGHTAIANYYDGGDGYPPLTHPWYSGKDADGNFSEAEFKKIYRGTTLTANGHFVTGVFQKERRFLPSTSAWTSTSYTSLTVETEPNRFRTVASFGNRVFYAGVDSAKNGGKIYFSKIVESNAELGNFYQVNDPTSEDISDLLDTDGGVVKIAEAHNIRKLHVFGAAILIFAENGVWSISGVDNVFRATEFSISKISDVGLVNENSFVVAGGAPIWWSKTGIYSIQTSETSGQPEARNLSLASIQTLWNAIPNGKKAQVFVEYDQINQRVFWFYPDTEENIDYKYNNVLVLDVNLQAFYPWKISDGTAGHYIIGSSYFSGLGSTATETQVVNGADTIINGSDTVVATVYKDFLQNESEIKLIVRSGVDGKLTVAHFSGDSYLDWGTGDYSSFAEAGYDFMGDMTTFKNAPYVTTYMRVTEDGYTYNGVGYDFINPSSCKMSVSWNLTKANSTPREIYKLKNVPVVDPDDLGSIHYPSDTVVTKSKVRGRGRSMKLRFESSAGKDFHLVGYEVIGAKNTRF